MVRDLVRVLYVALGSLCVALGVLGIFLPIVPTTPFLLLAAFFYARSSRRFYDWLLDNRWFGRYIRDFRDGKRMPRGELALTLVVMWITSFITITFVVPNWWGRGSMLAVTLGVTVYLVVRNVRIGRRGE